jgi:hypothetical protein
MTEDLWHRRKIRLRATGGTLTRESLALKTSCERNSGASTLAR